MPIIFGDTGIFLREWWNRRKSNWKMGNLLFLFILQIFDVSDFLHLILEYKEEKCPFQLGNMIRIKRFKV